MSYNGEWKKIPEIQIDEIRKAINMMKMNRALGEDGIIPKRLNMKNNR